MVLLEAPRLEAVTVNTILLPSVGVALLTVLVTCKSDSPAEILMKKSSAPVHVTFEAVPFLLPYTSKTMVLISLFWNLTEPLAVFVVAGAVAPV